MSSRQAKVEKALNYVIAVQKDIGSAIYYLNNICRNIENADAALSAELSAQRTILYQAQRKAIELVRFFDDGK